MRKPRPVNIRADEVEQLMARFHGPLMSFFLRRVRDRQDAEDLTQEAFLRIVGRDHDIPLDNPESYVFRVAVNLLRDKARRTASHRTSEHASLDDEAADLTTTGNTERALIEERQPERVLLSQESLAEALRVLDELGPRTRDIFMLARLERMKHRDIAAVYGMTVSAVEKHVAKAAIHLHHRFGPK